MYSELEQVSMRKITYTQAINEALLQKIAEDRNVFLIGQGIITVKKTIVKIIKFFCQKKFRPALTTTPNRTLKNPKIGL